MKLGYKKLGDYIQLVDERNRNLEVETLLGVSIRKVLMPSIANTIGTDMSTYKIIRKNQFAYGTVTSRNGDKISIALLKEFDKALVSQIYLVFEVIDENLVLPDYLMMWFRRPEFDRYARFKSHGSARESFDWAEMLETELPIPSLINQKELIDEYEAIENRIQLNKKLCATLEETAQTIYKHWFEDFEFPDENGKPYKSSSGEMVECEELGKEIPKGWRVGKLSDIASYRNSKISTNVLTEFNYISTENMLDDKRGITNSSGVPENMKATNYEVGNILISNIRPYLKKIWFADFDGGCSNDVLCLKSKDNYSEYLYFSVFKDHFFDYIMTGSKGTKMPRGDKKWTMDFPIILPELSVLKNYSDYAKKIINRIRIAKIQTKKLVELQSLLLGKMAVEKN